MKVLFIVQGEGRGHLTQAITLAAMLRRNGHEVVGALVGRSSSRQLPDFFRREIKAPVEQFDSPNFLPTPANKRNSIARSVAYNIFKVPAFARSIGFIRRKIAESEAGLVVNFYELLTGLTWLLFRPDVPQVSIGHQYLFLHKDFVFPDSGSVSLFFLRFFTRVTSIGATERLALSFRKMTDDSRERIKVVPPLLRREVEELAPFCGNYIHGYMVNAGFGRSIEAWHAAHRNVPLRFFWDKKGAEDVTRVDDTLSFHRIDDRLFLASLAGCKAYATTAGFESVCEAMYLGKPVLMVPAHIEQDCNAFDAELSGAGLIADDFDLDKINRFAAGFKPNEAFRAWADSSERIMVSRLEHAAETVREPSRLLRKARLLFRLVDF